MRTIDQESTSGKVIRAVGMGIGIAVALSNERTSYKLTALLIRKIFGSEKAKNFPRHFYNLRKQKIISVKKSDNKQVILLTEKGREIFLRFEYENLQIKKKKIWDRSFRLVIFDIPEKKKSARDELRLKIKEMGFVKFNDSVWAFPYPCQKEIDFIANYWHVGKHVHFAVVRDITNREELERYFNL